MTDVLSLAGETLLSPLVLFFALGVAAGFARSDLTIPDAVAKGLSLYLMLAIGFKGGAAMAAYGLGPEVLAALAVGIALSFALPLFAFPVLRGLCRMDAVNAAAVAAHYGSISVVTFVAATSMLQTLGVAWDGYMVAVVAAMETPAILTGLWLAGRSGARLGESSGALGREVLLNGSVVLLVGSFAIGWITGDKGLATISAFIVDPFKGVLCLFLLDMGLVAARRFRDGSAVNGRMVLFGLVMPLVGALAGGLLGLLAGLAPGNATLMAVLGASASYIAVPAAMRMALPQANPAVSITLALGITFPFNLTIGIPLYHAVITSLAGGTP
ncbi:sodium-dependent bicarbonate transport family permease [Caenispirillum bisanense]|uniref:sodium-dependent bicarbonate transport family permease n=1 Tax=Caenispirillum bisanense TaxID=414052 RepID=UPI0031DA4E84